MLKSKEKLKIYFIPACALYIVNASYEQFFKLISSDFLHIAAELGTKILCSECLLQLTADNLQSITASSWPGLSC